MTPRELATLWRIDAATFERYGDDRMANVLRGQADALDAAIQSTQDEPLDLATASRESGYSVDRLRHRVASGEIPNAGRKGAPRIRRGDLPRKQGVKLDLPGFDASAVARSLVQPRAS